MAYGKDVTGTNDLWVAVGDGTNQIAYSLNGTAWTGTALNGGVKYPYGVGYGKDGSGNGLWVVVGGGITPAFRTITTSLNGINWSDTSANGGFSSYGEYVVYGKDSSGTGLWIAVGSGTNTVLRSYNGTDWTATASNGGVTSLARGVAFGKDGLGNDLWVICGQGTGIATSLDGNNFTQAVSVGGVTNAYGVAYGNGLWVVVGTGTRTIAYSTDGTNWTGTTANGGMNSAGWGVKYGEGRWVAVGNGTQKIVSSTDGINWSVPTLNGGLTGLGIDVAFKPVNL